MGRDRKVRIKRVRRKARFKRHRIAAKKKKA